MTYDATAFLALCLWFFLMAALWGLVAIDFAQWIARRWREHVELKAHREQCTQLRRGTPADGSGE